MSEDHSAGIGRNTLLFIATSLVTAVIALVTVPAYLSVIGAERFGVYIVALLVVGYFALSDLGLGTATENAVARMGPDDVDLRSATVWTAVALSVALGIVGGIALIGVSWLLFSTVLSLPDGLRAEAQDAIPLFAACIPLLTLWSVSEGAINGQERFVAVNMLDTVRLTALQLLPLGFAYWWGPELVWVAAGILLALSISILCSFAATVELVLAPRRWARPRRGLAAPLLHFGKWISVTGLISPILAVGDRLIIGAIKGPVAVTVFSIPYNLASRLLVVPFSLIRVTFPRFSAIGAEESQVLGAKTLAVLVVVTAPFAVLGASVAPPFLEWWIGEELATNASPVAAILFAGIWVNGLGYVPYSLLQAQGRPDVPARYHMLELAPFLIVLGIGVHFFGPMGAALAWSSRTLVDSSLLLRAAKLPWFKDPSLVLMGALVVVAAANGAIFAERTSVLLSIGLPLTALSFACAWVLSPAGLKSRVRNVILRTRKGGEDRPHSATVDEQ